MNHRENPIKRPLAGLNDGFTWLAAVILVALAVSLAIEAGWIGDILEAIAKSTGPW